VLTVDPDDLTALTRALRAALDGTGPALALGATPSATPTSTPTSAPALTQSGASAPPLPEGTAVVLTTSGSTGVPKSVVLPASALRASAQATVELLGEGPWLLALPAGYVAGMQVLVRALVQGRTPHAIDGRFSPAAFVAAAERMPAGARFTSLVPAQLATLLDAEAPTLRSFAAVLVGGQALAPALREKATAAGVRVVRTYGSTETSGGCVYDGRVLPGVRVRIEAGEIQIAGPTLATGYLGDAALTADRFIDADGERWYRTGDAGALEAGVLRVEGRLDNVIVSGGVNISLDRVEQVVRTIPGMESAIVVGVPDERWGEASVIVAVHNDTRHNDTGQAGLLAAAREAVAAVLGAPARPSRLVLVDELDVLPSGKPDRERIRRALLN